MHITLVALICAVILQNAVADDFIEDDDPRMFVGNAHDHEEVVGNAAARARLHFIKARARARAHANQKKLKLHHPHHLLGEETPEQFMNSEPLVGAPSFYSSGPIVEDVPPPPPHYNPYPSAEPVLSILPGQWKVNDYPQQYYDSYQVTPVSYIIPDDYSNYYRNADPHKKSKKHKHFLWEEENERESANERHFHGHSHSHGFMHHGNAPVYDSKSYQPEINEQPTIQESFSSNSHVQAPKHTHQNGQQKTIVVLPPNGNFQVSQLNGNQNGLSQTQQHQQHHAQTFNGGRQSQSSLRTVPDPMVGAPNIVNVGRNRKIWQIPGPDEADVSVVIKRSAPLYRKKRRVEVGRLLLDPNAQMDVPKTLENARAAFRGSFENKHAPVFHLRNAMGSARDGFMSTLRILPQDFIIPSKYKIVEKDTELYPMEKSRKSNEISKDYPQTYNQMGTMFRDSIRSGQDVLTHMGDLMHSTRKALVTTPTVMPRVLISSLRVPAVQHPLLSRLEKRKQHLDNVEPRSHQDDPNFVGVSHIMDSLGLTSPQKSTARDANDATSNYYVLSDDHQNESIYDTMHVLNEAIRAMGVNTLKDFFDEIRKFKASQEGRMRTAVKSRKRVKNQSDDFTSMEQSDGSNQEQEISSFLTSLLNNTQNVSNGEMSTGTSENLKKVFRRSAESTYVPKDDESVGISMEMGPKLLTPFMGKLDRVETYVYQGDEDFYDDDYRKRRSSTFIE